MLSEAVAPKASPRDPLQIILAEMPSGIMARITQVRRIAATIFNFQRVARICARALYPVPVTCTLLQTASSASATVGLIVSSASTFVILNSSITRPFTPTTTSFRPWRWVDTK